jgi:TonB family protein
MKFCPTCETRYDEEILRFCTKDGTPLIDENQPNFTEMPSASIETPDDDINEETLVSYKPPKNVSEGIPPPEIERTEAPRIVIPMNDQKKEQQVRSRTIPPYQGLPQKSNTGKTVALTILGTLAIIAFGLGLFYFMRNDDSSNNKNALNVNTNPPDANLNTNLNLGGTNYNVPTVPNLNINTNFNVSTNLNANLKTPTPTSTPTPKPSPSASVNTNANLGNTNIISTPSPTPKPSTTPTTTPSATPKPSTTPTTPPAGRPPVNAGVMNGRALSLPKPAYPEAARQARANGQVAVQVLVDEAGNVLSAKATSGNPLLRQSAEAAARQTRFNPVTMNNQAVKAIGTLLYNFIN